MQLSRPYLIVLGAVVALAAAWMLLIRPHGQSSSTSSSAPSAPGVTGLATAVAKAHGAVQTSEQNAKQLGAASDAASNPQAAGSSPAVSTGGAVAPATRAPGAKAPANVTPAQGSKTPAPAAHPGTFRPAAVNRATLVGRDLQQGKVVVLLFWNSRGADDQAVLRQLQGISGKDKRVTVMEAQPSEVASFGSVTQGVQILETPTTLVIDRQGQAEVITGLTDSTEISQAITDAEKGGAGKVLAPTFTSWSPHTSRSQYLTRANHLCRSSSIRVNLAGSTNLTSLRGLMDAASAETRQLAAIPAPASDRATLRSYYSSLERGFSEFDTALAQASAHHSARTMVLQAQVDLDYGAQGLANYGLSGCFPQNSLTS